MPTNTAIEDDVRSTLDFDPRIPDPTDIAVSADDGTLTLRGTVGSFAQRRAAAQVAHNTDGVYDVENDLQVRLLDDSRRDDAAIRGAALQTLMWDSEVPAEDIDVKVSDAVVMLTGDVNYQFESDAAYDDVASLLGVVGVKNEIRVITP